MATILTGDTTKGIKNVGELALRISKFDSYRLFTLYENVKDRKVMDVSGEQKYYLVFKSPKKEIRIPEYDPKGFFEVDKVNGCILFKITKKNAEDILSMKTNGEKIFHIIRTYEERDSFGKVLAVTDEVEVYHGKWGDDEAFTTFTTENKVDLLTKSLAAQVDKNATQLNEYQDLLEKYNDEINKSNDLEEELKALRAERDSLQQQLSDYIGSTYDGTLLSTDTKYIAFEDTLENISFTEEQYQSALKDLMTKGEIDLTEGGYGVVEEDVTAKIDLLAKVKTDGRTIRIYKNDVFIENSTTTYNNDYTETAVPVNHGDKITFECIPGVRMSLSYEIDSEGNGNKNYVEITGLEIKKGVKCPNCGYCEYEESAFVCEDCGWEGSKDECEYGKVCPECAGENLEQIKHKIETTQSRRYVCPACDAFLLEKDYDPNDHGDYDNLCNYCGAEMELKTVTTKKCKNCNTEFEVNSSTECSKSVRTAKFNFNKDEYVISALDNIGSLKCSIP